MPTGLLALNQMCSLTSGMLGEAMTALADDNTELARHIRRTDDRVDDLQREIFAWTQQAIMDDVQTTEAVIDVLVSVARKLERIRGSAFRGGPSCPRKRVSRPAR